MPRSMRAYTLSGPAFARTDMTQMGNRLELELDLPRQHIGDRQMLVPVQVSIY